jgi:hypothetical protein
MKVNEEILSGTPDQRQTKKWRLFGRRRDDKARLMLIINSIAAVLMVLIGYLIG